MMPFYVVDVWQSCHQHRKPKMLLQEPAIVGCKKKTPSWLVSTIPKQLLIKSKTVTFADQVQVCVYSNMD